MATWPTVVELPSTGEPLFRRIADAIARDIERGRFRPGERLSSTRELAHQLEVNRNTVMAAYDELSSRGLITVERARGTFVAAPENRVEPKHTYALDAGFDLPPPLRPRGHVARDSGLLLLLGGVPDLRFLPIKEIGRAYRNALRGTAGRRRIDYGDPRGESRLRVALAGLLARVRGIPVPSEAIAVVRGSQQAIYLAAHALLGPRSNVAVEAVGYQPAWQALRLAGAELHPVAIDRDGLDVDGIERLCERVKIDAVYVTPHHQCPTGATLSPTRRARLLRLAEERRVIVFEDDYDFDFHYDGRPILPMAAADLAGVVVYFGTLSKSLAPGLRLGFVVAPVTAIERIVAYRSYVDCQGDQVLEHAVAELLELGEIQLHIERARRAYKARRDVLCGRLADKIPELHFVRPSGGMALWARHPSINTDRWVERARARGVAFQAGRQFMFDNAASQWVRIGFAACNEAELERATDVLASAQRNTATG